MGFYRDCFATQVSFFPFQIYYNKKDDTFFCLYDMNCEYLNCLHVYRHRFYCLTAAAALLTYTETSLCVVYNKKSLKVEYQESEGYCIIGKCF